MSEPSVQAIEAAQRATGDEACGVRAADAMHDCALGLDRSVCLRDVVEFVRGLHSSQRTDYTELLHKTADTIERQFGGKA